ncbi:twin-arginine translocase TatA/TatE family subunit [Chloroflexota bacterium]
MDLFGVGGWEVLLIIIIALIVWGPGRIAEISRTMGKVARNLRRATFDLTEQFTKETGEQDKEPKPQQQKDAQAPEG